MPRAEFARGRLQAGAEDALQRVVDREDHGFSLQAPAALARAMKRLRVLVLLHPDLMPPDSVEGRSEQEIHRWKTEYDVVTTLRKAAHEGRPLGVQDEPKPIRDGTQKWKQDGVFQMVAR